jgi:hypothetical protein
VVEEGLEDSHVLACQVVVEEGLEESHVLAYQVVVQVVLACRVEA